MAENTAANIAKDPVAGANDKARDTVDNLPPITKETAATADASMVPSAPTESAATDAPAASSSDATAKPEVSASAAGGQEASNKESNKSDAAAVSSEKTSDAVPTPVAQSTTTETVSSGADSNAPAAADGAAEPPKPVSVEEIRDEELPDAKPVESERPSEEASKMETSPAESGDSVVASKRKVDESNDETKPEAKSAENDETEPPEKKPKTNGTATNGTVRKPGRPKKDKTVAAVKPVGRTARKTRSQGAAD
ncbi:hypothetical protein F5B22DRAFT_390301 [Xylaria bambusicola]|uniref:uncharacterized protein n=1 Tax=Xylaria bambusicola TaxID=326684 RepID=UPI002008BC15|nr:uncharacterized protein F5B22DRAFT_390301 [Xylaria bambusicola]KAI0508523.1 hypothetical protein F5B22DRAFT_390301 [Xylaria bambusicola]